jgi:arylsulfatase A-like enzyme
LSQRAVEYIKRPHKDPFYLSLHYTAPHWPWEGPNDVAVSKVLPKGLDGFTSGGSLKTYAEIVKSMDSGVGRILDALRSTGLDRNTLVIFTSDNGGERFSFNWPFSGQKFDLQEGGVRVPAIVRWPGVTTPGSKSDQAVITMDWTATMVAAAGGKPEAKYPFDGIDLMPVLSGKRSVFDRTFFWRTKRQGAMRSGRWKYIRDDKNEFLYDLSVDECEQADFSKSRVKKLASLRAEYKKWESGMASYPNAVR